MKIVIRQSAADDLDRIFRWIAKDNPRVAAEMVSRIRERINRLELDSIAHMGRPGQIRGTRELVEYPYVIVYKIIDARREILVLSIFHGAQSRGGDR
jgi:addiction module RelE/StbE family toxin